MIIRKLERKEWEAAGPWYTARGLEWPDAFVPDTGFAAVNAASQVIGVGFAVYTNAKFMLMEYLQTDPKASTAEQSLALSDLVRFIEKLAIASGYTAIMGMVEEDNFPLARYYERRGARRCAKLFRVIYKSLGGE